METDKNEKINSMYYKLSEKKIKNDNYDLWLNITNYNDLEVKFKIKFYMYENNLIELPKCECGNDVKYLNMNIGFTKFCCRKCAYGSQETKKKRKNTCIKIYGCDNPSKAQEIKDKVKATNLEIFGVEYPLQSQEMVKKSKETCMKKYGVDNPSKVREIREKAENTMIEKFGVPHAMQNEKVKQDLKDFFTLKYGVDNPLKLIETKEKAKNTMISKYGVPYALQSKIFMDKLKNTIMEKYGEDNYSKSEEGKVSITKTNQKKYNSDYYITSEEGKAAIAKTNREKYGEDNYFKSEEHKNKQREINFDKKSDRIGDEDHTFISSDGDNYVILCHKCNIEFTINRKFWKKRKDNNEEVCMNCNPCINGMSYPEKEILDYIKSIYNGTIIENDRTYKKEIDVYLPKLKLGFEYNGLYWHSELKKDMNYHYEKHKHFRDNNIEVVQIWEDEWKYKKEIIKSMINDKLGLNEIINTTDYVIEEITDNETVKEFMTNNHLLGYIESDIKLGIYIENKLVSIMLFNKICDKSFELLRFCNILNYDIINSEIKLFNYFLSNYDFNEIINYSSNDVIENIQEKLGFSILGDLDIDYYLCLDKIRYNNKLTEGINYKESFRIYDSGGKKWKYTK